MFNRLRNYIPLVPRTRIVYDYQELENKYVKLANDAELSGAARLKLSNVLAEMKNSRFVNSKSENSDLRLEVIPENSDIIYGTLARASIYFAGSCYLVPFDLVPYMIGIPFVYVYTSAQLIANHHSEPSDYIKQLNNIVDAPRIRKLLDVKE